MLVSELILARHGESQFNAKSLWTGIWDVPLTNQGRDDAALMAHVIREFKPAVAYSSALSRARETLEIILQENKWSHVPIRSAAAFNERDYGELTGMNKWAVEEKFGETQFNKWRRGWDEPVPEGETLKVVYRRAVPYFEKHIEPLLKSGKNVLLVAHGNSLRTIIKHLDELTDKQVESLDMPFGEVLIYTFDSHGKVTDKVIRKIPIKQTPA